MGGIKFSSVVKENLVRRRIHVISRRVKRVWSGRSVGVRALSPCIYCQATWFRSDLRPRFGIHNYNITIFRHCLLLCSVLYEKFWFRSQYLSLSEKFTDVLPFYLGSVNQSINPPQSLDVSNCLKNCCCNRLINPPQSLDVPTA
jgi:hypothetical protein